MAAPDLQPTPPTTPAEVARPARAPGWGQLRRSADDRAVAGVAGALAHKLNVTPLAARAAFVALSFAGGLGIALYLAAWLWVPPADGGEPVLRRALADHRTLALVAAAASGLGALMVAVSALGSVPLLGLFSPGLISLPALIAVWRDAGTGDRDAIRRFVGVVSGAGVAASPTGRRLVLAGARLAVGLLLIAAGTSTLVAPKHLNGADIVVAFAAIGVVAGVSLILAPWWFRLGRELSAERRERARAEERAEVAAHVHDSVLHTLALIQRSAEDPQQVQRLARAQERELRSWLFGGGRAPANLPPSLAAALAVVQRDVEADHGVRVELVTVGDAALDEQLGALVAAAREAAVNSAKWSGDDVVSIYAEVEPELVSVFVRDRGKGFDPGAVAPDRKGLSESVHARMRRNGGTSSVRSTIGEGTEVIVTMPRTPRTPGTAGG